MVYCNGDAYLGYWKKNMRRGGGKLTTTGTKYVGSWEAGLVCNLDFNRLTNIVQWPWSIRGRARTIYWRVFDWQEAG